MTATQSVNYSEELADFIIEGIREKKGLEIVRVDLRNMHNSISDYFVICHATSDRQVDAISQSIEDVVRKRNGDRPNAVEGKRNADWILLDYVDVVVHVFKEEIRRLYALEDLWADAPIEQIGD
ncbi:MAG: ribosome silencing factor [Cryomorphaceae bacterium]